MAFKPPSREARHAAVGGLAAFPAVLQRTFAPDTSDFEPIPKPGPHDWLALRDEPGQTFEEFKASRPNRLTETRHTIYLQPLGNFPAGRSPSIEKLSEFASAFFAMRSRRLLQRRSAGLFPRVAIRTRTTCNF